MRFDSTVKVAIVAPLGNVSAHSSPADTDSTTATAGRGSEAADDDRDADDGGPRSPVAPVAGAASTSRTGGSGPVPPSVSPSSSFAANIVRKAMLNMHLDPSHGGHDTGAEAHHHDAGLHHHPHHHHDGDAAHGDEHDGRPAGEASSGAPEPRTWSVWQSVLRGSSAAGRP